MFQWKNASSGDLKRLQIIQTLLRDHPKLLEFLFHNETPELRTSPELLLRQVGAYSSGERILIRVALDIWSESGATKLLEILSLDFKLYERVIHAISKIR